MRRNVNDISLGLDKLPESARAVVERLIAVAAAHDMALPPEMLEEISAISVKGVDPKWQIDQLQKILDRWAAQQ